MLYYLHHLIECETVLNTHLLKRTHRTDYLEAVLKKRSAVIWK